MAHLTGSPPAAAAKRTTPPPILAPHRQAIVHLDAKRCTRHLSAFVDKQPAPDAPMSESQLRLSYKRLERRCQPQTLHTTAACLAMCVGRHTCCTSFVIDVLLRAEHGPALA